MSLKFQRDMPSQQESIDFVAISGKKGNKVGGAAWRSAAAPESVGINRPNTLLEV